MKLNLGCGDRYVEGWYNIDHESSPHKKDAIVDLTGRLPWANGTVTMAYAGHVLEHLSLDGCLDLLERLRKCMVKGGTLMVVGPDLIRARQMAEAGTLEVTLDSLQHGAHRWPGDEHQWECTPELIEELLVDSGWHFVKDVGIENVDDIWPVADRGPLWQCAVQARP